jgi:hypothetical protein
MDVRSTKYEECTCISVHLGHMALKIDLLLYRNSVVAVSHVPTCRIDQPGHQQTAVNQRAVQHPPSALTIKPTGRRHPLLGIYHTSIPDNTTPRAASTATLLPSTTVSGHSLSSFICVFSFLHRTFAAVPAVARTLVCQTATVLSESANRQRWPVVPRRSAYVSNKGLYTIGHGSSTG